MNLNNTQLVLLHRRMKAACYDFGLFFKKHFRLDKMNDLNCDEFEDYSLRLFELNFFKTFNGDVYDVARRSVSFANGQMLIKRFTRVRHTKKTYEAELDLYEES